MRENRTLEPQGRKIAYILFIAISIISCRPASLKDYDKPYFDFDSLVAKQIQRVAHRKGSIQKVSVLDQKKDVITFFVDSTQLAHEWDVVRQLDIINKPTFKGNYEITERADTKSNLSVRLYAAKVKSTVPYIHFYYQSNFKNLKRIESQYEEQNALYYTARKIVIAFDDAMGEGLIHHYSIEGSQKMIFTDSAKFSIHGSILFK